MSKSQVEQLPRIGMFAIVRNRRGVVSAVEPYDGETGRLHLVHLEYKDDQHPVDEQLLWELEPRKTLLEPTALPDAGSADPMPAADFDALLCAARWSAALPYLDPDKEGPLDRLPVSSPFHGAVQIEDYQLVPLLKALRMPRVNLLIADDVGLGKTIEAGLILTELLLRRRIQRVLILTPASLRLQWRDEMWERFSLPFDLIDRAETHNLRKRLGMDANPWRSFSRIIASYHYLRQEDVLEQFLSACRTPEGSPHLPWDLLIVDECHNLMPSAFGDDSDLCRMLRLLAPQFEHRLFLSATPHNGHTRCFTGLLEILDPVRFSQTTELRPAEKERIQQVVIRRLKREINARTNPPKFCTRHAPKALLLNMSSREAALGVAFDAFRKEVRKLIAVGDRRRRRSGSFAVEILGKRLLSCPTAFAESWRRCKEGLAVADAAADAEVAAVERTVRQETGDDRETQSREATAASVVGAWLKAVAGDLSNEIGAIDNAVAEMGFDLSRNEIVSQNPYADARFDTFISLVEELLLKNGAWREDERLVVFTEYKTTLDYLVRRLRERFEADRILMLFGGMDDLDRDVVKLAFNDPVRTVRILLATDAAAEGLNLQWTARYMLHYDCPWNPSKLEQRNGRIDRHGQARDVIIHHFVSDQDQDLSFLAHVIRKAHEIREDLGSSNELFDEAAHRRLVNGESLATVKADLDRQVEATRGRAAIEADATVGTGGEEGSASMELKAIAAEIDLDSGTLRETLEAAMAIRAGRPQLECAKEHETYKVLNPGLPGWSEIIDDSLRLRTGRDTRGPVALVLLSVEELAVNDLRECYHHWVRTIAFPIRKNALREPLPHRPALKLRCAPTTHNTKHRERARDLFQEIEPDLKEFLRKHAEQLTADLRKQLGNDGVQARKNEDERYRSRQGEVSHLIAENTLAKLEREVEKLKQERQQGSFFDEAERLERIDQSIEEKKEEIVRRTRHYEEVRAQLDKERERILKNLLPKRHSMSSDAQAFPVVIEIRFPGGTA